MIDVESLSIALLSEYSVSPDTSKSQDLLIEALGFRIEKRELHGCRNFWDRIGSKGPLLFFCGHTDVVPPGELDRWTSPPFKPTVRDGKLYARGAADMKSSVCAMVAAADRYLRECSGEPPFSIGFLITGDEELGGDAAREFLADLVRSEDIRYCLVGEPSSEKQLGDTAKIGRRGSLRGNLTIHGNQGHVGYPALARNAVHLGLKPLLALSEATWDSGNEFFQPTSFQITSINPGIADNVILGELVVQIIFRFSVESTVESLEQAVTKIVSEHCTIPYTLSFSPQAQPFLTEPGEFTAIVARTVYEVLGRTPAFSTAGGTSDARFFAQHGVQVVELGPNNQSIHRYDEHVCLKEQVRFASPLDSGSWRWEIFSAPRDLGLSGHKGELCIEPLAFPNRFQRHGFWRIPPGGRNLVHADGTPALLVADTAWALPWRATHEQCELYAQDREAKGFNAALLMSVQPDRRARGPRSRSEHPCLPAARVVSRRSGGGSRAD